MRLNVCIQSRGANETRRKLAHRCDADGLVVTICVRWLYDSAMRSFIVTTAVCLALLGPSALAHPLQDAAHKAAVLCAKVAPEESLEYCGTEMGGRTPEHSAARRGVRAVLDARAAFMRACDSTRASFYPCAERADWYIGAGIADAFPTKIEYADVAPATPQSDRRR